MKFPDSDKQIQRGDPHERGLVAARKYCQFNLGDESWADSIIKVYLYPESEEEE